MDQQLFQVCVLGSANSDHFLEVQDFPKEGETIAAKKSYIKNGGKGANQAVASALLGTKTVYAGQIGKEQIGQKIVDEMVAAQVDMSGLKRVDEQTGQAIILLNSKGENLIIIVGGANQHYAHLDELPPEYGQIVAQSDFLQVQMEIPQAINLLAAQKMRAEDKFVMLDCGGKAEKLSEQFLENLTFISPNETELERLIGEELNIDQENFDLTLEQTVHQKVFTKYPHLLVLLKLGAKGSFLVTKDFSVRCPTVTEKNPAILNDYKIVDTVGAGDCFTSAFCSAFYKLTSESGSVRISSNQFNLRTLDYHKIEQAKKIEIFRKAMEFASAAAFLCITKHGAMPSMPSLKAVEDFIAKY